VTITLAIGSLGRVILVALRLGGDVKLAIAMYVSHAFLNHPRQKLSVKPNYAAEASKPHCLKILLFHYISPKKRTTIKFNSFK